MTARSRRQVVIEWLAGVVARHHGAITTRVVIDGATADSAELADKAEASRFTEMKIFLQAQSQQTHSALMERIETLEKELAEVRNEPPPSDHTGQCKTCTAGDLCCEHEAMH